MYSKRCFVAGLHFHVVGEGVVRVRTPRQERVYDRENYIDFRMRLLGEPGNNRNNLIDTPEPETEK